MDNHDNDTFDTNDTNFPDPTLTPAEEISTEETVQETTEENGAPEQNTSPDETAETVEEPDPYHYTEEQWQSSRNTQAHQDAQSQNVQNTAYHMPKQDIYGMGGINGEPYKYYPTGFATASLVIGIISVVLAMPFAVLPFMLLLPIVGLILGIVYKTKHYPIGKGLSTAGIVLNSVGIGLSLLILIGIIFVGIAGSAYMSEYGSEYYSPEQIQKIIEEYSRY
jgi:hypothetical protein